MAFKFGKASREKLKGVHPDLVKVAERALALSPVDFKITCGLRTKEEQRILLQNGKTTTMNSRHLTGHAIDFVPLPVDWHNTVPFRQVAAAFKKAAKELGVAIRWGGDWARFIDMPHIELDRDVYPAKR